MSVLQRAEELGFNLSIPSHSTRDAPLIVILGWLGCQVRDLGFGSPSIDLIAASACSNNFLLNKYTDAYSFHFSGPLFEEI